MTQALPKDVPQTLRGWKRYPAYKDSGVEWLGEVPEHWDRKRIKYVLHQIIDTEHKTAPYYPDGEYFVVRTSNVRDGKLVLDDAKYTDYEGFQEWTRRGKPIPGDILFTREAPAGEACLVPDNVPLCIGQRMVLFRVNHQLLNGQYGIWSLYGGIAAEFINSLSQGSTVAHFNMADIGNIPLFVPSVQEQYVIASFLDRETAKIDALIAKKERLIALLEEKRSAIISHAVTKGLDPSVPLENSGIDWLGEVPAHWKVLSVRRLAGVIEQGWSPVAEDRLASENEWGVIKLSAVNQGLFRPEEHKTLPEDMEADQRYEIKAGDFLVTRANTPNLVGDVCVVSNTRPHLMLCDLVYRVSVDDNRVSRNYLCYWFLCRAGRYQITRDARGSSLSMVKVSQNSIRSWLVALPPFLEQQAIASYLDNETAKIDALIAKIREGIEKLKEYRTALISAAVIGKIDVRNEIAS